MLQFNKLAATPRELQQLLDVYGPNWLERAREYTDCISTEG